MTLMNKALTIAGSDTSGGAGMEADIKTMEELGVYGMPALTCIVTMHPTTWEHSVFPLPLDLVEKQLVTAIEGVGINAMKTGMLGSAELVELVAATIDKYNLQNVVIDPVMVCKGCDLILVPDAAESIKKLLMPRCDIITPNTVEAAYLADMPEVTTVEQIKEAAEKIVAAGAKSVVIKGGERLSDNSAIDIFYDGKEFTEMAVPKIYPSYNHGAGCTFSAAITAGLANGLSMKEAVLQAKKFVTAALKHGLLSITLSAAPIIPRIENIANKVKKTVISSDYWGNDGFLYAKMLITE